MTVSLGVHDVTRIFMKTVTSGHSWTTITVTMEDGNEVEINLHHDKSIGAALPLFMGQKE